MKIFTTPTHYILNPDCHEITPEIADFLGVAFKSMPKDKSCAFDLSRVSTCTNKFFRMLENVSKEKTINIINISDKMMATLCLMKYDKFVKIYTNDLDMFEERHEVKNRRFKLIGA